MSKKNKRPKLNQYQSMESVIDSNEQLFTEDGFQILRDKTKDFQSYLAESMESVGDETYAPLLADGPNWNAEDLLRFLTKASEKVAKDKFKKALPSPEESAMLRGFIFDYAERNIDREKYRDYAEMILKIGKTFYEFPYMADNQQFIDDATYDKLLSAYLSDDSNKEPSPFVPSNKKSKVEVTDDKYPNLAINMNKSYALLKKDPIPDGVKETESVEAWLERCYKNLNLSKNQTASIMIRPKLDGIAVHAEIKDGKMVNPLTRGSESKSILIKGLNGFKVCSKSVTDCGMQFEAFVCPDKLNDIAAYLEKEPFVSPRHAASSLINRLCTVEDDKLVSFLTFYPISIENDKSYLENQLLIEHNLKLTHKLPKDMLPMQLSEDTIDGHIRTIRKVFETVADQRASYDYAIDGIVISFIDDTVQQTLGRSGRTNRWQIALKFDPSSAKAVIDGISISSGKKGYRTIQVELKDPVFIDGVRYDHIPVLSAKLYQEFDPHIGDKITVHRVGDVIPSITLEQRSEGDRIPLPTHCPDCGEKLIIKNEKLYCENPECKANQAGLILGFLDAADVKGIGVSAALDLVNHGVHDIADFLEATEDDFEKMETSKKILKKAQKKLHENIQRMWDYEVIGALGIPGIGPEKAKGLVEKFHNIVEHPDTAETVYEKLAIRLWKYITKTSYGDGVVYPIVGHTMITLSPEDKEMIEERGFRITDGKKFDVLITGNKESDSGKMKSAKKKNLPIMTFDEFMDKYKKG